jgi:hypothetical protein
MAFYIKSVDWACVLIRIYFLTIINIHRILITNKVNVTLTSDLKINRGRLMDKTYAVW